MCLVFSSSEEDDNIDVESEWISGMRSEHVEVIIILICFD